MLTPDEQMRVDAAGSGVFATTHRTSVDDVLRDLRQCRARAVVLSTAFCREVPDITRVARVVREFPQVPTVALLSQVDRGTARAVLTLGQCGIRTLVDVREPTGWRELRNLLAREQSSDLQQVAIAHVLGELPGVRTGVRRFAEVLFEVAARAGSVGDLALVLQLLPSTMMSRFFRAALPPPRRLLTFARLVFAARWFENPGLSISRVATQMDYSSAQSFGRHMRQALDCTAQQFRDRYDARGMLQRFCDDLVVPYRAQWLAFDPLVSRRRPPRRVRRAEDERPLPPPA
jgi:AraC-like DNA-binding protein